MQPSLIESALRIAVVAHAGQLRKNGLPYITHPAMCAFKLQKAGFSDTVVAAALVHDVLEDTNFSEEAMREALGNEVTSIVRLVSYDPTLSWEEQRVKYIKTLRNAPADAKAVATADKIHNAESLLIDHAQLGSGVWKKFSRNKKQKLWFEEEMLKMLKETWQHPLVDEYAELFEKLKLLSE